MSKKGLVSLNLYAAAADPTTPTPRTGDIYWSTATAGLRRYDGAAWSSYPAATTGPPTGAIEAYVAATPPSGWLLCDGGEYVISTYLTLYNLLTTTGTVFPYGANTNGAGGAGSSHFRTPNLKGRVAVGFDSSQTEFDVLGETGGAKTVALALGEMPAHTHDLTHTHGTTANTSGGPSAADTGGTLASHSHDIQHTHSSASAQTVIGSGTDVATAVASSTYSMDVGSTSTNAVSVTINGSSNNHTHTLGATQSGGQSGDHAHSMQSHTHPTPALTTSSQSASTTTSQGSGTAHQNLQPYITLYYIIKT